MFGSLRRRRAAAATAPGVGGASDIFYRKQVRTPKCKHCLGNNTGPGGTGGSAKLKSSKGDNTLRDGRKGDPLHECGWRKTLSKQMDAMHKIKTLTELFVLRLYAFK